ncbi:unnamed protein product [Blepharisma stoltei]|uniref:RRM domain-containing protein n=1 Tax=Blepharisma stoltei TaxID=1481888 RepID=A0AAU9JIY9_9CILI|nr:unnamed protein product [Blepharisma stoltei]
MDRSNSKNPNQQGSTLYLTNLSYSVREEELLKYFEEYGKILDLNIIKDPISNRSRGFGFATYENDEDAEKAKNKLNKRYFGGRKLRIEKANRHKAHVQTTGKYMGTEKYKRSPNRDYRDKEKL